jgi:hypothetical protein
LRKVHWARVLLLPKMQDILLLLLYTPTSNIFKHNKERTPQCAAENLSSFSSRIQMEQYLSI